MPAGSPAPAAISYFDAANNTGKQTLNVTATLVLSVPATALIGTYNSTFTIAVVAGP